MRVYLAGPINGCTDAEANDWRAEAKRLLAGHDCLDPMARDYRGLEAVTSPAEIVEADCEEIASCDAMLVMALRPSWGTAMEIVYASQDDLRVVAVAPADCSPWLRYHTAYIAPTLEEAVAWLIQWS